MKKQSLPKLRSVNRETYNFFIARVKDYGIKKFRTKNELAAFIEDIKWPGLRNDGTKPKYAVKGNYQPIINHLLADGVLAEKFDGYRYSYKVKKKAVKTQIFTNTTNVKATASSKKSSTPKEAATMIMNPVHGVEKSKMDNPMAEILLELKGLLGHIDLLLNAVNKLENKILRGNI